MNRDSFLSQPGQGVFVRWWDPRIGNASSYDDDVSMDRPRSLAFIPDMDDTLHPDDVLQELYPMPSSSRSDSLSSASTHGGPATPSTPPTPLWTASAATSKRPSAMHNLPVPKERRRPSSVSSSTSSMASRATAPRSILARNNSTSTSAMGSRARRAGAVTFADRPQVLSCKYEVDEDAVSEMDFGPRHESAVYTSPLPSSNHLPDPDATPRPTRTRGREREKEKGLFNRLRSALSPSRNSSPHSSRRRGSGDMSPPTIIPSTTGRSSLGSFSRASGSRGRSHDEPPVIGRPQPLRAHSSPYGQDIIFGSSTGDGRSVRSTRSAASLRSTSSVRSQDERKRGGLKSLLGLFR